MRRKSLWKLIAVVWLSYFLLTGTSHVLSGGCKAEFPISNGYGAGFWIRALHAPDTSEELRIDAAFALQEISEDEEAAHWLLPDMGHDWPCFFDADHRASAEEALHSAIESDDLDIVRAVVVGWFWADREAADHAVRRLRERGHPSDVEAAERYAKRFE